MRRRGSRWWLVWAVRVSLVLIGVWSRRRRQEGWEVVRFRMSCPLAVASTATTNHGQHHQEDKEEEKIKEVAPCVCV